MTEPVLLASSVLAVVLVTRRGLLTQASRGNIVLLT